MKTASSLLWGCLALGFIISIQAAGLPAEDLGFSEETQVIQGSREDEICLPAALLQHDDGTFENGYAWRNQGIVPPDYGSWAESYDSEFVCGAQFLFTQVGNYSGQTIDIYVWERPPGGDPPGPNPGNVLCKISDLDPGPPAFWPDISTHDFQICCDTDGPHFIGFWVNAPGEGTAWFLAADEDNAVPGEPRTKVSPYIEETPEGWQHPENVIGFEACRALGIREFSTIGDCSISSVPAPVGNRGSTWGRIKSLY